jgi:hypothetical protein
MQLFKVVYELKTGPQGAPHERWVSKAGPFDTSEQADAYAKQLQEGGTVQYAQTMPVHPEDTEDAEWLRTVGSRLRDGQYSIKDANGHIDDALAHLSSAWQHCENGRVRVYLADARSLLERAAAKLKKAAEAAAKAAKATEQP